MIFSFRKNIRRILKIFLISTLFTIFSSTLYAQLYHIQTFTKAEGLPQLQIFSLFQDRQGFLWIGTAGGLSRYDGFRFYNIDVDVELPNSEILSLTQDSSSHIWIGTAHGLCQLSTEDYFHPHVIQTPPLLINDKIYSLKWSQNHTLWIATLTSGLWYYKNNQFISHPVNQTFAEKRVVTLKESPGGDLWILYNIEGLVNLDMKGNIQKIHRNTPFNKLVDIEIISEEKILLLTTYKLFLFYPRTGKLKEIKPKNEKFSEYEFSTLAHQGENLIYIACNRGLIKIENDQWQIISQQNGLLSNEIRSLIFDREKNLWIGSYNFGLTVLFSPHALSFNKKSGLENTIVNCIYKMPDGEIYLGTDAGIFILYQNKIYRSQKFKTLNYRQIWTLYLDKHKRLWIGTDRGIILFQNNQIHKNTISNFPNNSTVMKILEDSRGDFWFATDLGLYRYNGKTAKKIQELENFGIETIWTIFEDKNQRLFCGSNNGLVILENGKLKHFNKSNGLPDNAIFIVYQKSAQDYYFGSNRGLIHWDGKQFTLFGRECGLHSLLISAILEDDNGNLWLGNDKGVDIFNGKNVIKHLDRNNGLIGEEFTTEQAMVRYEDNYYFGFFHGLTVYPAELVCSDKEFTPQVYITDVEAYKDPLTSTFLNFTQENKLKHSFNTLNFQFISPWFRKGNSLFYSYRLIGYDQQWSIPQKENHVRYTNLNPGKYQFQVQALNKEGNKKSPTAEISFSIEPPFWSTLWFRIIAFSLILLISVGIFTYKTRSIRRRNRALEKKVQKRTKELTQAVEYIKNIIEHASDVILTIEKRGKITAWNREGEETFGYSKEEILHKDIKILDLKFDKDPFQLLLDKAKQGEIIKHLELRKQHKNGKIVDVFISISPIETPFQKEKGFSIVMTDISEQNQLKREMMKQQKLLGGIDALNRLMATLSHHINNAAASILGITQTYELNKQFDHQKLYRIVNSQTQRIIAVLKSLSHLVETVNLKTRDYIGEKDALFDIEQEINTFIQVMNDLSLKDDSQEFNDKHFSNRF